MQPPSTGQGGSVLGMSAPQLQSVGSDIAAGGSIMKGIGGYEAGKTNARIAEYNKQNSWNDETGQEAQVRDQARLAMGEQIASEGGSGIQLGTGSAADVLQQSAINAQLDAMNLRRKATIAGENDDLQAWQAKQQGKAAFLGGIEDAASSVFSGAANYAVAGL